MWTNDTQSHFRTIPSISRVEVVLCWVWLCLIASLYNAVFSLMICLFYRQNVLSLVVAEAPCQLCSTTDTHQWFIDFVVPKNTFVIQSPILNTSIICLILSDVWTSKCFVLSKWWGIFNYQTSLWQVAVRKQSVWCFALHHYQRLCGAICLSVRKSSNVDQTPKWLF